MSDIEKYNKLLSNYLNLSDGIKKYHKYREDSNIDKLRLKFEKLEDHYGLSATKALPVALISSYGTSGCSSVQRFISLDDEIFHKFFLEVLNDNVIDILEQISNKMCLSAFDQKNKVLEHIQELNDQLESISKEL